MSTIPPAPAGFTTWEGWASDYTGIPVHRAGSEDDCRMSWCIETGLPLHIHWKRDSGLTGLLHEIGHFKCEHGRRALEFRSWSQYMQSATAVQDETDAHLAGEKLAHELGVEYDYVKAEQAFRTYSLEHDIPWKWRVNGINDIERTTSLRQANKEVISCRVPLVWQEFCETQHDSKLLLW